MWGSSQTPDPPEQRLPHTEKGRLWATTLPICPGLGVFLGCELCSVKARKVLGTLGGPCGYTHTIKNTACHSRTQGMLWPPSYHITASLTVSPEGAQDGDRMLQLPPTVQDEKNTGYWPQIAGVHIKGMIWVSSDSASAHM